MNFRATLSCFDTRLPLLRALVFCQLFNECGAAVWGTSNQASDAMEFNSNWDILHKEVRNVEVVWSPVHRSTLGRLLLEQLQVGVFSGLKCWEGDGLLSPLFSLGSLGDFLTFPQLRCAL